MALAAVVKKSSPKGTLWGQRMNVVVDFFGKSVGQPRHSPDRLHYFHHNFIRKHQTLKTTPAVAAGIANAPLMVLDLVRMIGAEESKLKGRLTDYLPAASKNP